MIHIQCFPKFCKDKTWTIYAPKIGEDVPLELVAKYVHTTFRKRMEERKSEFLIGFIPDDKLKINNEQEIKSTQEDRFDWDGYHYLVVTKEIDQVFMHLPDMVSVDDHVTVFVAPNSVARGLQSDTSALDVVKDAQRIFFVVALGILLLSWLYARSVNQ